MTHGKLQRRALLAGTGSTLLLAAAGAPFGARAGTMTGAATEWTQIMNNVTLIQQVIHAIQQVMQLKQTIKYWAQTVKTLGRSQNPIDILRGVQSAISTTRTVLFAGETLARRWNEKQRTGLTEDWAKAHPGSKDPHALGKADPEAFRRVDERVQLAVEKTMRTLDSQYNQLDTEEKVFARLQQKVSGEGEGLSEDDKVKGQLQAAMLANELLLELLKEQKLTRQLLQSQALLMGEQVSAQAQYRQYDDAIRRRDPGYTGRFRGGRGFNGGWR